MIKVWSAFVYLTAVKRRVFSIEIWKGNDYLLACKTRLVTLFTKILFYTIALCFFGFSNFFHHFPDFSLHPLDLGAFSSTTVSINMLEFPTRKSFLFNNFLRFSIFVSIFCASFSVFSVLLICLHCVSGQPWPKSRPEIVQITCRERERDTHTEYRSKWGLSKVQELPFSFSDLQVHQTEI